MWIARPSVLDNRAVFIAVKFISRFDCLTLKLLKTRFRVRTFQGQVEMRGDDRDDRREALSPLNRTN
jgi:hypothetical protein